MSKLVEIYIAGLGYNLGHFPTAEELKADMIENENGSNSIPPLPDRTMKFYLKIGLKHRLQEQHTFEDIECIRRMIEIKRSVLS